MGRGAPLAGVTLRGAPTLAELSGRRPAEKTPHAVLVIAERLEPEVRDRFLEAVEDMRDRLDVRALEAALIAGDLALVDKLVLDALREAAKLEGVLDALNRAFQTMGTQAAAEVATAVGAELVFDVANPFAVEWMREYGARFVTNVTDSTRQAIADYLAEAIESGRSYSESAAEVKRLVAGLDSNSQRRLAAYRRGLEELGVSGKELQDRLAAYAEALLNERAQLIASYETVRATNAGQEVAWRIAQDKGLLSAKAKREWITTPDDRLCPDCLTMDGVKVGLNEPFRTPVGEVMTVNDIHVRCRCSEGLAEL